MSYITVEDHALIASALAKLGPEKVRRAMVAFFDPSAPGDNDRCFLARAFGEPGAWHAFWCGATAATQFQMAGLALGLSEDEVDAIVSAFDGEPAGGERTELMEMALAFLGACGDPMPLEEEEADAEEQDAAEEEDELAEDDFELDVDDDPWDEDEVPDDDLVEVGA